MCIRDSCSHRCFRPGTSNDLVARARCLLLWPLVSAVVLVALNQPSVRLLTVGLLPVWKGLTVALQSADLRPDLGGFLVFNLVHHHSWGPGFRANAHRHRGRYWRLVGRLARTLNGLIFVVHQLVVNIHGVAACMCEHVRKKRVNEKEWGGKGKPEGQFYSAAKVLPVGLVDVLEMAHAFTSMTEQAVAREQHRYSTSIRFVNDLLISDGATRLNDGDGAGFGRLLEAVFEREKGVRG